MRDWRRPVKELPELMREAGYFREAARLEREFTLKRISRLLGGDYMMILLACELVKSVKRKWKEEKKPGVLYKPMLTFSRSQLMEVKR